LGLRKLNFIKVSVIFLFDSLNSNSKEFEFFRKNLKANLEKKRPSETRKAGKPFVSPQN
jgi:hypothetical protein